MAVNAIGPANSANKITTVQANNQTQRAPADMRTEQTKPEKRPTPSVDGQVGRRLDVKA